MIRPLAIASLLFASQAMAGESIVIPAQPYTLKCLEQYQTIEACIKGLVEVSRRLTVDRDKLQANNKELSDVGFQLSERALNAESKLPVPEPKVKPAPATAKTVQRTGCRKKWRTLKNGRKKYRCI